MHQKKVQAFREWEAPGKLKEVQEFLGFAIFYQRFIRDYGKVVQPFTNLYKKLVPFCWGPNERGQ
jgi:hypothetical protein